MAEGRLIFWSFSVATLVIILTGTASGQSDTCPTFGTDQTSIDCSREERIFLNFEAPSQCRGNVTLWNYCHYRSEKGEECSDDDDSGDNNPNTLYGAKLLVYRRSSPTSEDYVQVPGSVTELVLVDTNVRAQFRCGTITAAQPFEIQENDVIAACVWDDNDAAGGRDINPLLLAGDNANANQLLYQYDRGGLDDCTASQLASVDTGHNDFRQRRDYRLHLYADIAVSSFCRVGNNPAATSPVSTSLLSGTYLNTDHPVNCATENTITSWHYCYYTSGVTPGQTYTMTVGVWSLDASETNYLLTAGSSRTITLVPVATLAKVFCVEETLNPTDYIFVSQDDVIGVVLPATNAIPVLSSTTGVALTRHSQTTTSSSLVRSQFTSVSNSALHLYSNLGYQPIPTTVAPTTMAPTTEVPTTMAMTSEEPTTQAPTTEEQTTQAPTTEEQTTQAPTTEEQTTQAPTTEEQTTQAPTTEVPTTQALTTKEQTTLVPTIEVLTTQAPSTEVPTTQAPVPTTQAPVPTTQTPTTEVPPATAAPPVRRETTAQDAAATSSVPFVPTDTTSDGSNTDSGVDAVGGDEGLSTGDVSAVVLSIVIVAIILSLAVLMLLLFFRSRKKKSMNKMLGMDNVTYSINNQSVVIKSKEAEADCGYDEIHIPFPSGTRNPVYSEIYKEVEDTYYSSLDAANDYQERIEEVRSGRASSIREDPYHNPASDESTILMELKKLKICNIPGSSIEIGGNLGSGQFGTVDEGKWLEAHDNPVQVAVKSLNQGASGHDRIKFLQEAAIMAQFRHPNVVALHGVAHKDGQIMLVVELLSKGDLRDYLLTLRPDPGELVQPSLPHVLLEFSQQICLGMSYLAEKGFIHRDLAARNILLSEDNICKIADFGMSRDLEETDYYLSTGGKIPLKWTAPEAFLYKKYSTASDVWSYGCVLYEIWSLGTKPFEGIANTELVRKIQGGVRLPPPPGCPKRVYEVMIQTWSGVAGDRPSFREMLLCLLENKTVVLTIPSRAKSSHPQAGVLGAPIEAGQSMYTELQNMYRV